MSWQLRETSRGQHDLFLRGWAERSATFVEASVLFLEVETLWRSYRSYQFVAVVSLVLFSCVLLTASLANVCRILNLYTPIIPTPRSVLFVLCSILLPRRPTEYQITTRGEAGAVPSKRRHPVFIYTPLVRQTT